MNRSELVNQIKTKRTFLCVGLDTDLKKVPQHILKEEDPIFSFNKAIIDATADYCVAYKPNLAFYEAFGVKGLMAFEKTVKYLKENYPNHFIVPREATSATQVPCMLVHSLRSMTLTH